MLNIKLSIFLNFHGFPLVTISKIFYEAQIKVMENFEFVNL